MKKQYHPLRWLIWTLAVLFYFYEYLIRVFPSVLTTELTEFFQINAAQLGALSAYYIYAYAPMQLVVGPLMDRYGARSLITIACLFCGLSTFLFGITSYLFVANLSRFLMGIGSAFGFIGFVYICSHWFSGKRLAYLVGIGNSFGMLGAVFGLSLLSYIFSKFPWDQVLFFIGIGGIILSIIIFLIIRKEPEHIQEKESEKKEEINLKEDIKLVLKNSKTWINGIVALLLYAPAGTFAGLWATPFLKTVHNLSTTQAGTAASMIYFGIIIGGPIIGTLSDKMKSRKFFLFLLTPVCLVGFIPLLYFPPLSYPVILAIMFIIGIGAGVQLLTYTLSIELNTEKCKGTAVAVTNFLVFVFCAFLQTFIGILLDYGNPVNLDDTPSIHLIESYELALTLIPASLLLGLIFVFFLKEEKHISHITYQ